MSAAVEVDPPAEQPSRSPCANRFRGRCITAPAAGSSRCMARMAALHAPVDSVRCDERAVAAALGRAAAGSAQLILVDGPPCGDGTTPFVDAVVADATAAGFRVARGCCWAGTGAPPL